MKSLIYNGVPIEVPVERPVFSHSHALKLMSGGTMEGDRNIPYFEKLMKYKEDEIPEGEMLSDVCRLYSISNLNYQVSNGGFTQYYFNGYHKFMPGYDMCDLSNTGIECQLIFLQKLIDFMMHFDFFGAYLNELFNTVNWLEKMYLNIIQHKAGGCYGVLPDCDAFDKAWGMVSDQIEFGMELYAQYLIKRLEAMKHGTKD